MGSFSAFPRMGQLLPVTLRKKQISTRLSHLHLHLLRRQRPSSMERNRHKTCWYLSVPLTLVFMCFTYYCSTYLAPPVHELLTSPYSQAKADASKLYAIMVLFCTLLWNTWPVSLIFVGAFIYFGCFSILHRLDKMRGVVKTGVRSPEHSI